jgi:hypothetical protein
MKSCTCTSIEFLEGSSLCWAVLVVESAIPETPVYGIMVILLEQLKVTINNTLP